MAIDELQRRIAAFTSAHDLDIPLELRLLDLVAEVGQLAKVPLKAGDYGRSQLALTDAWADELGDVLFTLTVLANQTGVDLADALDHALTKYEARLAHKGHPGSPD